MNESRIPKSDSFLKENYVNMDILGNFFRFPFLPQWGEKAFEDAGAFLFQDTVAGKRMMVIIDSKKIDQRAAAAGFGVGSSPYHPIQTGVDNGAGAHGTRLKGDI